MYHSKDGLFFERLPDGSVEVTHRVPVIDILALPPHATPSPAYFATLNRWVLGSTPVGVAGDCSWPSIVSGMSTYGENGATFDAARRFHHGNAKGAVSLAEMAEKVRVARASLRGYTGAGKDDPTIRDILSILNRAMADIGEE